MATVDYNNINLADDGADFASAIKTEFQHAQTDILALEAGGDAYAFTKQAISGTGTQTFDLDDGWLADDTISGNQTLDFTNGSLGANGVIKLINTNGNTLSLSGSGLTFKKSNNGVLEVYAAITLEAGASTEQLLTYHFQSATEVIYTI